MKACISTIETIKEIRQKIVRTLRARFDAIKGEQDVLTLKTLGFHQTWGNKGFYNIRNANVK
jgi:hypothetical protein